LFQAPAPGAAAVGAVGSEPGGIKFTFQSITGRIQSRPLDWEPPMRELLRDPEAADFVWRRLQYVFKLPDPRAFPALGISWTSDELQMLQRFITQAERLAEASLIGAEDRITIDIADDGQSEDIDAQVSPPDLTFGFVALFRQCYVHDEDASFAKVRKLLQTRLHERSEAEQVDVIKQWRKAHAKLDGNTLEELAQERMVAEGQMPPEIVQAPASPRHLFEAFWSGDQMHWGNKRRALKVLQRDPVSGALADLTARQALVDFAHLYIGFAVLVSHALGQASAGEPGGAGS
jgi:hypothetical protein